MATYIYIIFIHQFYEYIRLILYPVPQLFAQTVGKSVALKRFHLRGAT